MALALNRNVASYVHAIWFILVVEGEVMLVVAVIAFGDDHEDDTIMLWMLSPKY